MTTPTLGQRLALRREDKGWSQEVLATMLDTTGRTISRWETDGGAIPLKKQLKLLRMGLLDDADVEIDMSVAEAAMPEWASRLESKVDVLLAFAAGDHDAPARLRVLRESSP